MPKWNPKKCCYCGACVGVCPQNAITLEEPPKIVIDKEKCIKCGACVKICPAGALKPGEE